MTLANLKIKHARLKWLASGEFTERDFDFKIAASNNPHGKPGEAGRMAMGDMKPARKQLIQQDAKRALENLERKYPVFTEQLKTHSSPLPVKKEEIKSKGKK